MKAFKLVKTINSLKAKTKKEGKEQNWAKLLKKTESYKEIFNLFDKVTSDIISSSHGMMMQALLPLLSIVLYPYTAERRDVLGCTSPTTKRFPEAREMSRGRSPRDISRAEGNLEVGGDVQPNTSRLEAVYGHSLIINPYQGMYQEIHPYRAGSIDSVEINTSLLMMRE